MGVGGLQGKVGVLRGTVRGGSQKRLLCGEGSMQLRAIAKSSLWTFSQERDLSNIVFTCASAQCGHFPISHSARLRCGYHHLSTGEETVAQRS